MICLLIVLIIIFVDFSMCTQLRFCVRVTTRLSSSFLYQLSSVSVVAAVSPLSPILACISKSTISTNLPFKRRKIHQNLKIVKFSLQLKLWDIQKLVFINFEKKKSNIFLIFYTCIPENVTVYHSCSMFTQHYYVYRVLFVLNVMQMIHNAKYLDIAITDILMCIVKNN